MPHSVEARSVSNAELAEFYFELYETMEGFESYLARLLAIIPFGNGLVVIVHDEHNSKIGHIQAGHFGCQWSVKAFHGLLVALAKYTDLTHAVCEFENPRVKTFLARSQMEQIGAKLFSIRLK